MDIKNAAEMLLEANYVCAFTGAGISVESGIPPFRGENGLWSQYDPIVLDINYFHNQPLESWKVIKEIFYDFFGKAEINSAHRALAELEEMGIVNSVITQNIDNLHSKAGSRKVYEFHGNSHRLICENCANVYSSRDIDLSVLPPICSKCETVLKPDFVFFGEPIPEPANSLSFRQIDLADLFLVIGTTGKILPASLIPFEAKRAGAKIVEINIKPTNYTHEISDLFLQGKAGEIMDQLLEEVKKLI